MLSATSTGEHFAAVFNGDSVFSLPPPAGRQLPADPDSHSADIEITCLNRLRPQIRSFSKMIPPPVAQTPLSPRNPPPLCTCCAFIPP